MSNILPKIKFLDLEESFIDNAYPMFAILGTFSTIFEIVNMGMAAVRYRGVTYIEAFSRYSIIGAIEIALTILFIFVFNVLVKSFTRAREDGILTSKEIAWLLLILLLNCFIWVAGFYITSKIHLLYLENMYQVEMQYISVQQTGNALKDFILNNFPIFSSHIVYDCNLFEQYSAYQGYHPCDLKAPIDKAAVDLIYTTPTLNVILVLIITVKELMGYVRAQFKKSDDSKNEEEDKKEDKEEDKKKEEKNNKEEKESKPIDVTDVYDDITQELERLNKIPEFKGAFTSSNWDDFIRSYMGISASGQPLGEKKEDFPVETHKDVVNYHIASQDPDEDLSNFTTPHEIASEFVSTVIGKQSSGEPDVDESIGALGIMQVDDAIKEVVDNLSVALAKVNGLEKALDDAQSPTAADDISEQIDKANREVENLKKQQKKLERIQKAIITNLLQYLSVVNYPLPN